jgi:hypothetical protein
MRRSFITWHAQSLGTRALHPRLMAAWQLQWETYKKFLERFGLNKLRVKGYIAAKALEEFVLRKIVNLYCGQ